MKLFISSFYITCKHSSRRLLCLLCVMLVFIGVIGIAFTLLPKNEKPIIKVAVVNLDPNPITNLAFSTVTSMESVSSLFEIEFFDEEQSLGTDYTAIITIPNGFTESVMTFENISPIIELNISSPLEAMLVKQLAQAGTTYINSTQLGIFAVQEEINYGENMSEKEYNNLIMMINLEFFNAFLNRTQLMSYETISASGSLNLFEYYISAIIVVLFLCYSFLFTASVDNMRRFSKNIKSSLNVFFATISHIIILNSLIVIPLFMLLAKTINLSGKDIASAVLFILLISSFAMLISLISDSRIVCTVSSILITSTMALFSGVFLPLSLMPKAFTKIAPFTATYQGMELFSVVFGEDLNMRIITGSVIMIGIMLVLSVFLWRKSTRFS